MAAILIVWLIVGFTALGLGLLVTHDLEDAFWIGWVVSVALLLMLHFFIPIKPILGVILAAISAFGWLRRRPKLNRAWLIAPIIAVFLAGFATSPSGEPDDGGYQWQIVKWYADYPAVPGLANLHGRFGFNSTSLLYGALFNELPGAPMHYALGTLFIASATSSLLAAKRMRASGKWSDFFQALMIFPVLLYFRSSMTLETSVTSTLIAIVIIIRLARLLDGVKIDQRLLILFVAMAITVKLSVLVFAGVSLLVAWYVSRPSLRSLLWPLGIALGFGLIWMGHGIVLSGLPLFPSTIGGLNVDWRVHDELANRETSQVTIYARYASSVPKEGDGAWGWIPAWWERIVQVPAIYSTVLMLPLLIFAIRRPYRRILLLVPALAGLLYWFVVMPSTEFGLVSFFTLGLGAVTLAMSRKLRTVTFYFISGMAFLSVVLYMPYLWNVDIQPQWSPEYETYQLADGNLIYTPVGESPCWGAPLPCTIPMHLVTDGVVMRTGQLQDGYRSR